MNHFSRIFYLLIMVLTFSARSVMAEYALPYPSFMPGHKLYGVSRLLDRLKEYWHWGNIARVKYHLGLSDKYLVEAKTLFEYKQYLLATGALNRSNEHFQMVVPYLEKALNEGKDTRNLEQIVEEAASMHLQALSRIKQDVPSEAQWKPEKSEPVNLQLHDMIFEAMSHRVKVATYLDQLY